MSSASSRSDLQGGRCGTNRTLVGRGLGISSDSGGGGGFMTARGTANLMTRTTTVLAVGFFTTTIILAIMAGYTVEPASIVDEVLQQAPSKQSGPTVPTGQ